VLNVSRHERTPRRLGLHIAWISIAAILVLIALRGLVVWRVMIGIAPCPACMGATAMQQDCTLLGIFLGCAACAFVFRAYLLQFPFLAISAALFVVMAIDTLVLLTLTQRLYVFDVLKFGKELGAIVQFARLFLASTAGKISAVLAIGACVLIACLFAPRPRRPKPAFALVLLGAVSLAFGSWRPSTMSYIHYELLQNVLAANLELGVNQPYTAGFAEQVKRDLKPQTPICVDRGGEISHPNILFVLEESLSMHHSELFGGVRDLTPHLDSIARKYTYLPDFYANGFSTDGGLISLISGRPPIPAVGRYESTEAFKGFDSPAHALPDVLHNAGYDVNFLTTGDLGFLGQEAWMRNLHFDHVEGAENPFYDGMKRRHFNAAEDKALYQRFLQWMDARTDAAPWFAMLLTVSTHPPFINPETEQTDEPGVFKYADTQIGVLFDELNRRHFFDNGILLISGDHRSMTPLFAQEQIRFGDSAMARVPMVIATNLPIARGALAGSFQQTDLVPSIDHLTNAHSCRTDAQGLFLSEPPVAPKYVVHARGDKRGRLDIYFKGTDGTEREGNIILNGDASRWIGDKPDDWQQIMLRVEADRVARGSDKENALDYLIDLYFPHPASAGQSQ
jgi:hypothetical protein